MYTFLPHTADVQIHIEASSSEELLGDAVAALFEVLGPEKTGQHVERVIAVDSVDRTTLVIDFLSDVLSSALTHREAYDRVTVIAESETSAEVRIEGTKVVAFEDDVKAVTYHGAEVRHEGSRWTVDIVLDI